MGKFFIAVALLLFIAGAANAQCSSGFSRSIRVQPGFQFSNGFNNFSQFNRGVSNRQLLLLQAEQLGVASRFEARFQNGLSLNDELVLRQRIQNRIRGNQFNRFNSFNRNSIQFNRGGFSFGFGF